MSNNVVLGDLSLYDGDDCLKFGGSYLTIPPETYTSGETVRMDVNIDPSSSYNYLLDTRDGGGDAFVLRNVDTGGWNVVNCRAFINGVEIFYGSPVTFNTWNVLEILFTSSQPVGSLFARTTGNAGFTGFARNVITKSGLYIQNGDFGDTALVDHSGNGNDGTIVGATWWKQGIDENYATPDLFKSTLVSPLTEDQNVVYTDATPYYGSDDVFWNPYNQDATFDFTVTQQQDPTCAGCKTYSYSYSYSY